VRHFLDERGGREEGREGVLEGKDEKYLHQAGSQKGRVSPNASMITVGGKVWIIGRGVTVRGRDDKGRVG
jgi:hypothetical protein